MTEMSEKESSCDKIKRNVKMFMDTYKKNNTRIEILQTKNKRALAIFEQLGVREEQLKNLKDEAERQVKSLQTENRETAERIVKSLVKLDDLGCGLIE